MMGILNVEGRFDAYAKIPSQEDMTIFEASINKLEKILINYNNFLKLIYKNIL